MHESEVPARSNGQTRISHFALKLYRKFDSTNENLLRDKNGNKNGNNNNLARFILDLYTVEDNYILLALIVKIIITE